jgi:mannose-6-phosphate isomerase-like protein (cupin superfamily)
MALQFTPRSVTGTPQIVWYDAAGFRTFQREVLMSITRREICLLLAAGSFPATVGLEALATDDNSLPSATYSFDKLPVNTSNKAEFRAILKGKLATGESLEAHETTLPPGGMPHAPHRHVHSEMWLVREGTVELTINGAGHVIGPGGLGFVHSNDEHGIKNTGTTPATYFVVAVGPGAGS